MFNNHYYFTFQIDKIKDKTIPKHIIKYINRFLFWRGRKILYFEPFTDNFGVTTIVIGSLEAKQKVNRNGLIFILELYAHLKDSNISVSDDFKSRTHKLKDYAITIYKIKKFKVKKIKK